MCGRFLRSICCTRTIACNGNTLHSIFATFDGPGQHRARLWRNNMQSVNACNAMPASKRVHFRRNLVNSAKSAFALWPHSHTGLNTQAEGIFLASPDRSAGMHCSSRLQWPLWSPGCLHQAPLCHPAVDAPLLCDIPPQRGCLKTLSTPLAPTRRMQITSLMRMLPLGSHILRNAAFLR